MEAADNALPNAHAIKTLTQLKKELVF